MANADKPGPVSNLEEQIFRSIYLRKKKDGIVHVKNTRGRPVTLQTIRVPEKPSNLASKRTNRERSKIIDNNIKVSLKTQTVADRKWLIFTDSQCFFCYHFMQAEKNTKLTIQNFYPQQSIFIFKTIN